MYSLTPVRAVQPEYLVSVENWLCASIAENRRLQVFRANRASNSPLEGNFFISSSLLRTPDCPKRTQHGLWSLLCCGAVTRDRRVSARCSRAKKPAPYPLLAVNARPRLSCIMDSRQQSRTDDIKSYKFRVCSLLVALQGATVPSFEAFGASFVSILEK